MKSFILLILSFVIISCNSNRNSQYAGEDEYSYNDLTVNFIRHTRVITFIKEGKPISGTVVQELKNGRKNIWYVENGLATKQTRYYPNGQIERMLEMKNGMEHGTFVMFFTDGQKHLEQFYEEGEPVGTWHRWNKEGELIETMEH
jgi:antitoxin component YwqK of YwqJK toxin-antitoxin module